MEYSSEELNKVDEVNSHLFIANAFWLFFTSLIPFITKLKNTFPDSRFAAFEYVTILALWLLSIGLLDNIAVNSKPKIKKDEISSNKNRTLFILGTIIVYGVAFFYPPLTSWILVVFSIIALVHVYKSKK